MTESSAAQRATQQATEKEAIRPFPVANVPESELADLRKRIVATRWPERETVTDATQGVQLATTQALARYWATDYDWRKCEAKLQSLPQFITEIDGLDIHFIHVRSKHEDALPLIVTHGWPGSITEQMKIIESADQSHRTRRKRIRRVRCRDSVHARLRFFRQANDDRVGPRPHCTRLDRIDEAPRVQQICGAGWRLGRNHHRAYRRPSAAGVARHSHQHGKRDSLDIDKRPFPARRCRPSLSADEKLAYDRFSFVYAKGIGYGFQMGLRPQTLYGIADSPVGLAAYFLDHDARSYEMIARVFDGGSEGPHPRRRPRQHHAHVVDENGGFRGASLLGKQIGLFFAVKGVVVPVAVSVFPDELYPSPRSWAERAYPKLIHYNKLPKGGHFAAWEQPKLFSEELRAGFRSLR